MTRTFSLVHVLVVFVLVFVAACSSDPTDHVYTVKNEGAGVVIVLGHEVSDFETWQTGFESRQGLRDNFGIVVETILHGEDDPQIVWIIASAPSQEVADSFLVDVGTARTMETDGVIGEVYSAVLDKGYTSSIDPALYPERLIVQHAVKDFDEWKQVFDGHIGSRERTGVADMFVSHPVGDSTDVHMMFGISNPEEAIGYMSSDALRIAMKLSGVEGEPRAYFVRVAQ